MDLLSWYDRRMCVDPPFLLVQERLDVRRWVGFALLGGIHEARLLLTGLVAALFAFDNVRCIATGSP